MPWTTKACYGCKHWVQTLGAGKRWVQANVWVAPARCGQQASKPGDDGHCPRGSIQLSTARQFHCRAKDGRLPYTQLIGRRAHCALLQASQPHTLGAAASVLGATPELTHTLVLGFGFSWGMLAAGENMQAGGGYQRMRGQKTSSLAPQVIGAVTGPTQGRQARGDGPTPTPAGGEGAATALLERGLP
jgi:hypothetical protein